MIPDADVIGFGFGIPYDHMLGHRGFSHSLIFAISIAAVVARFSFGKVGYARVFLFLFVSTASHGILDALTTGGKGVGFWIPLTGERYFFPWRIIKVSPLTIREFISPRGLTILTSEFLAVWLPCTVIALTGYSMRKSRGRV